MPGNDKSLVVGMLVGFGAGYFFRWIASRVLGNLLNLKGPTSSNKEICEVIFTNDPGAGRASEGLVPRNEARIVEIIDGAKKTLDIAVYIVNAKNVGAAVIRAHERGIAVRVVGCSSMAGATGSQYPEFEKAGIRVLFKKTSMAMHHKFCLVDTREQTPAELAYAEKRQRRKEESLNMRRKQQESPLPEIPRPMQLPKNGVLVTGSCNWTMQGFAGNWENILYSSNEVLIREFQREFNRIYDDFIRAQVRGVQMQSEAR